MRIQSIDVKNYRTLENISVNFSNYYTSISGKNNAGKTNIVKVIEKIFGDNKDNFYRRGKHKTEYSKDKTQWLKNNSNIEFNYKLLINKKEDEELFLYVEKFKGNKIQAEEINLKIRLSILPNNEEKCVVSVDEANLDPYGSSEILKKFRSSIILFTHNSTDTSTPYYHPSGEIFHEIRFSQEEKNKIKAQQKKVQKTIKGFAKGQKEGLTDLLGQLKDKYEVELDFPENYFSASTPCTVNLKDKNVVVPLSAWGSGTKNRTQIMLSILEANRTKLNSSESKVTPIIIIEEPESFLHPSAQAEFGHVLSSLATDMQIQIIVTTHSPYMLSQGDPSANVLLDRKVNRKKLKETCVVETKQNNWMKPFGEILGLNGTEFESWKDIITTRKNHILLVEGETDKEYIEHINSLELADFTLPSDLEIIAYGGKDALKNTIMLKFIIGKFDRTYITFDNDASDDLKRPLEVLNLKEDQDFIALGKPEAGKDCIEALVPPEILSSVYGENTDLVMKLSSSERKEAKRELKKKILKKFKDRNNYTKDDLVGFAKLFKNINKAYT